MEEALQELLPALEAQICPADDKRNGQEGGRHRSQQQPDGQNDEELVAQGSECDLLDDGQFSVRSDAGDVLRCRRDIVHGGGRNLRRGLDGHGSRVINGRQRHLGESGNVIEKSEEA